ncbi:ubinuclein-2-like isoform X2 [Andrographis paniculata]|uniref:ubinuclein-2-like isoform X2 n=1 Tax=Andrographis paniculata TaxID=175694 RepID=UPI0021E6EA5A|nr:ubinuclein-2-like isoform X2 [Andrographis paniculata]
MVEGGRCGGPDAAVAAEADSGSKPASSFERTGDRMRLTVELRPDETTIVSWKKLVKEATSRKANVPDPSASLPNLEVNQLPVSQPLPSPPVVATSKQPAENGPKSSEAQPGSNRLASVIEKIERLYAGNGSSDDEDVVLDDVPDDDEYDTEDSFIDDAELDDYFKIDKSTLKHDGFFVNRGKLERIEPTMSTDQLPKKRRRKDGMGGQGGEDGHRSNKLMKTGNKSRKAPSLIERNSKSQLPSVAASSVHSANLLSENYLANAAEVSGKKKTTDTQIASVSVELPNSDAIMHGKGDDHQRNKVLSLLNHNNKQKESSELRESSAQRSNDRNLHGTKSQSGKQRNNADEQDQSVQGKTKVEHAGRYDLHVPAMRDSQTQIMPVVRKEGSNVRSRITMLEKAIRDLEKIVAESRPPSTEVQENDNSSQGVKRRLPADIKQKLAKVARLAHDSYGKVSKDVINRLMSIVGHLMQLRTLKRNLKVMANLGMSAKQAKDDQLHKIKQEVAEMVRHRISYVDSKVEEQNTNSDDFQEASPEDKEILKRKRRMDDALENKICDLYDLYVERLEEHSGPPVKRLYEELAALWPTGVMDVEGIKRAIYKGKFRRKAISTRRKDQEKNKKKLLASSKPANSVQGEAINLNQSSHTLEKISLSDNTSRNPASTAAAARLLTPTGDSSADKQKQERVRSSSNCNPSDAESMAKKKVKRKPNPEKLEAEPCMDKPTASQSEEKQKNHKKHAPAPAAKPNLKPNTSEDPS